MARKQEYGMALNWNYVIVSIVVFVVLTILVLYMPNIREIDGNILHSIRLALSPVSCLHSAIYFKFWKRLPYALAANRCGKRSCIRKKIYESFFADIFYSGEFCNN